MSETKITFTGDKSKMTMELSEYITLEGDEEYSIGLHGLYTSYSWLNVNKTNNVFRYANKLTNFKEIVVPEGSYELYLIIKEIEKQFDQNKDYDEDTMQYPIQIVGNPSTFKTSVYIRNNDYKVDFSCNNSIGSIFGFDKKIIGHGLHISDSTVNINPVNTVLVHCNLASGNYYNGRISQHIFDFKPKVAQGYDIIENPNRISFSSISHTSNQKIHSITTWITDQDLRPIDLRGEKITISLVLCKK